MAEEPEERNFKEMVESNMEKAEEKIWSACKTKLEKLIKKGRLRLEYDQVEGYLTSTGRMYNSYTI